MTLVQVQQDLPVLLQIVTGAIAVCAWGSNLVSPTSKIGTLLHTLGGKLPGLQRLIVDLEESLKPAPVAEEQKK